MPESLHLLHQSFYSILERLQEINAASMPLVILQLAKYATKYLNKDHRDWQIILLSIETALGKSIEAEHTLPLVVLYVYLGEDYSKIMSALGRVVSDHHLNRSMALEVLTYVVE